MTSSRMRRSGTSLIAIAAAAGCAISIFNYYSRSSGIDGTEGALLVIASSAAICLAALVLSFMSGERGWLGKTLFTLIFIGILGTGLAAYFLESYWLLLLMALCLLGWIMALFRPRATQSTAAAI